MNTVTAILLTAFALLTFTGCATTGGSGKIDPAKVDQWVVSNSALITQATKNVAKVIMAQVEKDPIKRQEMKEDVNQIVEKLARSLDLATKTVHGTLTPEALAEDLKARDENVQAFFDGLIAVYQIGYAKLEASGQAEKALTWARLILDSTKVLADGLNKATS